MSHCVKLRVSPQREGKKVEIKGRKIVDNKRNRPDSVDEKEEGSKVIGFLGAYDVPEIGYMKLLEYYGQVNATEALRDWMTWYWKMNPGVQDEGAYLKEVRAPESAKQIQHRVPKKCGFTRWCML